MYLIYVPSIRYTVRVDHCCGHVHGLSTAGRRIRFQHHCSTDGATRLRLQLPSHAMVRNENVKTKNQLIKYQITITVFCGYYLGSWTTGVVHTPPRLQPQPAQSACPTRTTSRCRSVLVCSARCCSCRSSEIVSHPLPRDCRACGSIYGSSSLLCCPCVRWFSERTSHGGFRMSSTIPQTLWTTTTRALSRCWDRSHPVWISFALRI